MNNLKQEAHFCQNLTIQASAKEQSLKYLQLSGEQNSCRTIANYILLHAYSRTTAAPSCESTNKSFIKHI